MFTADAWSTACEKHAFEQFNANACVLNSTNPLFFLWLHLQAQYHASFVPPSLWNSVAGGSVWNPTLPNVTTLKVRHQQVLMAQICASCVPMGVTKCRTAMDRPVIKILTVVKECLISLVRYRLHQLNCCEHTVMTFFNIYEKLNGGCPNVRICVYGENTC